MNFELLEEMVEQGFIYKETRNRMDATLHEKDRRFQKRFYRQERTFR